MDQRNYRNIVLISMSQAGMAFSFSFVMVFLPFYVNRITPYSREETLIWVGLIMGAPSFLAAVFSTVWGAAASRHSPKRLYMRGLFSHGAVTLLMGFVSNLPLLLLLRAVQGILGGISTVGLVIVTASSSRQHASRDIGLFQNSLTFGQLLGPPVGAFTAAALGYRSAFVIASAFIFVVLGFCFLFVVDISGERPKGEGVRKPAVKRDSMVAWGLCFLSTVQLMFLPSVLPNVLKGFRMEPTAALRWAGLVVMFYTATAMLGTYLLCRLAPLVRTERLIVFASLTGALLQSGLSICPGLSSFLILRMVQTALIASVTPLAFSLFTTDSDGKVLGFLNSGRFAGNALGPMIATSILSFSSLTGLYLSIASMGLVATLCFILVFAGDEGTREEDNRS